MCEIAPPANEIPGGYAPQQQPESYHFYAPQQQPAWNGFYSSPAQFDAPDTYSYRHSHNNHEINHERQHHDEKHHHALNKYDLIN